MLSSRMQRPAVKCVLPWAARRVCTPPEFCDEQTVNIALLHGAWSLEAWVKLEGYASCV